MLIRDEELRDEQAVGDISEVLPPSDVQPADVSEPVQPAPPITNRFLLVNVAALRAKQLRRGAFPRLQDDELERVGSSKPERIAMEEIQRGLVHYEIPEWAPQQAEPVVERPRRRRVAK